MVEASNNRANAINDKTPMTFAITTATTLSFGNNKDMRIKTLKAEKSIGHILRPKILTPYQHVARVVLEKNIFKIKVIQFTL